MNGELQWPTLGDWIAFFLILIVGSFIAGFIDAWWERRKQKKMGEEVQAKESSE